MRWALVALAALGCGAAPPCPPTTRAPVADRRPFLWQVTGERGTVTLFGTFHAAGRNDIPGAALERLRAAKLYATEAPPGKLPETLPPGESLEDKLGPASWKELTSALSGTMSEKRLERAQPWVAMAALTAVSIDAPEVTMDAALLDVARHRDLKLAFLETQEAQAGALSSGVTVDDLKQALAERRGMRCAVKDLAAAYRDGDGATLRESLAGGAEAALLLERNRKWLPVVEDLMDEQAFVAVGVSHLVGEGSLPALLEERGYKVTRLGP